MEPLRKRLCRRIGFKQTETRGRAASSFCERCSLAGGCVARRLRINLDMRPPRALPAAYLDRNERYAYFGDRTLADASTPGGQDSPKLSLEEILNAFFVLSNSDYSCYFIGESRNISAMITSMQRANAWSQLVIGAAIEVHRIKGPGLIEEIYSKCLGRECELRNIPFVKELHVFLEYKGFVFEQPLRLDILIDEVLIVELKAVEKVLPIHKAQLLSYMKLLNKPLGLLINFHELVLRNGIYRMILKGGDSL